MAFPNSPLALTTDSTDREIMGCPESYIATRFEWIHRLIVPFTGKRPEELVDICESPEAAFAERLGAATWLGIIGDIRINTFNPPMVDIPGAVVTIGLDFDGIDRVVSEHADLFIERSWIDKECPAHQVALKPYKIGMYPVTNTEFREFLLASGYPEIPSSWELGTFPDHRANHPVYTVSAQAAEAYCAWLVEKTGRAFRLPTEVEWEHAAAGPDRLIFPWGDHFEAERANTIESGLLRSTPVGIFPAGRSCFGAYDLAGNVEEYVADNYHPYRGGPWVADDLVHQVGSYKVARGGSFSRFRDLARCKRRHGRYPRAVYVMGFRLAEGE